MKRIGLLIGCLFAFLMLSAQVFQPVTWSGERVGDSVKLTATIEPGWHMTLISIGDEMKGEEYAEAYSVTLAQAQPIRYNACDDKTCTSPEIWEWNGVEDAALQDGDESPIGGRSLWVIFLLGLLGGFMAIFTPCVWPIIPMTVSFFLKKGGGIKDAVLYGISIVIIYVGLGLLITIIFGASALNALSTNAIVNLIFFALLVVFALSFFGLFEITLPDSWSTALDNKARSTGGFLSILLMAFTLVIVSFSCTGPIIGTLLVEAAGKSLLAPAIGMLGFAIALALPFALFAMFPQWIKQAPKSGDWMTSFKVVLAFLELALSLKFLSVADMAYGWGILPRWLFIAIWIVCFLGIGIYLIWDIWSVSTPRKIIRAIVIIPSLAFAFLLRRCLLRSAKYLVITKKAYSSRNSKTSLSCWISRDTAALTAERWKRTSSPTIQYKHDSKTTSSSPYMWTINWIKMPMAKAKAMKTAACSARYMAQTRSRTIYSCLRKAKSLVNHTLSLSKWTIFLTG